MGVQLPLPAPSILFVFTSLLGHALLVSDISGANLGTVHILFIFNMLKTIVRDTLRGGPATIHRNPDFVIDAGTENTRLTEPDSKAGNGPRGK